MKSIAECEGCQGTVPGCVPEALGGGLTLRHAEQTMTERLSKKKSKVKHLMSDPKMWVKLYISDCQMLVSYSVSDSTTSSAVNQVASPPAPV